MMNFLKRVEKDRSVFLMFDENQRLEGVTENVVKMLGMETFDPEDSLYGRSLEMLFPRAGELLETLRGASEDGNQGTVKLQREVMMFPDAKQLR